MPVHVEYRLLSKLIETGDMRTVHDQRITVEQFFIPEAQLLFGYIVNYNQGHETRNLVPSREIIKSKFPTVPLPDPDERTTLAFLCQEVREEWLKNKLSDLGFFMEKNIEDNPQEVLARIQQEAKALLGTTEETRDVILAESGNEIWREYLQAKNADGYKGIPYPSGWGYHDEDGLPKVLKKTGRQHHPLNEQSRGMLNQEFILLYGRPKSMKTWLLIDMAVECYQTHRCRTLIFTKEMSPEQIRTRFVSRMLEVDYLDLRNGTLSEEKEADLRDLSYTLKDEEERYLTKGQNSGLLITTGWKSGTHLDGLSSLQAKIDAFEPDIVFADAVYLMEAVKKGRQAMWQDIADISRGLKAIARDNNIPVVATSQANRKGEETKGSTMAEIAYGDAFAQDCDVAARVIKTEDDQGNTFLSVILAGAREIKLAGFRLLAEPAVRFELDQVFESQRQIQAQFKAEEEMIALEEERAVKRGMKKKRKLNIGDRFAPRDGDDSIEDGDDE